jgi:hypothetical protein
MFSAVTLWFFKWQKIRGRINFSFVMMGNEAGYTEMIPTNEESVKKGFKQMTLGGIIASGVLSVLSIAPLFLTEYIPFEIYAMTAKGMENWLIREESDFVTCTDALLSAPFASKSIAEEHKTNALWRYHVGGEPYEA